MKLPTLQAARQEAVRTLQRFPFVLACAALGALSAVILIDHEGPSIPSIHNRVLFGAILGLPLLSSLILIAERRAWSRATSLAAQIVGVLLLVAYGFSVPLELDGAPIYHVQRLAMLAIGLCGLLIVGPYLGSRQLNGFWHYGKALVFRVFLTGLYSGVLFVGLAIALAALDNLFGIDVPGKWYPELWVLMVGIFGMWFFLAGVPENWESLEGESDYPKGLKVFVQYVLLPLMFVYLVILYAYLGKIIIQWSWPKGWVGGLTLSFAAAGIATLLLLHPVREKTENRWIKAAARWFWVVMLPPIVMLILALIRRTSEYGVTEARYVGCALGVWLAGMAVYFIMSRVKNIVVIPGSLAVAALLISFGPWGAFHVSETSQVGRLRVLLTNNEILVNAKVQKARAPVSDRDATQISSIIRYLREVHGYERVQDWFDDSLVDESLEGGSRLKDPSEVAILLGVEYLRDFEMTGRTYLELAADPNQAVSTKGYDRLLIGQHFGTMKPLQPDSSGDLGCVFDTSSLVLTISVKSDGSPVESLMFDLGPMADSLAGRYESRIGSVPAEEMTMAMAAERLRVKLCLRRIQYRGEEGKLRPFAFDADVLYFSGNMDGVVE